MKHPLIANLYNPHEQSREQLISRFVVRQEIFQELYQELKSADPAQPGPHYLIEGQRGAGKTTLLLRLSYEIEQDPELRARFIPIVFKEEAYYGIRRLFNLWETLMCELAAKDEAFAGLFEHVSVTYDGLRNYERVCFEAVVEAIEAYAERGDDPRAPGGVILFIDNLGEMLHNFTYEENERLSEFLSTFPHFRIVGTSSLVLEAMFRVEHPFHGFFVKKRMEGLNKDETYTLLRVMAKSYGKEDTIQRIIEKQPGRVESLRILTGGVIRTIILLFEVFTEQEESNTITDLDTVLDRVTPLYKHRMDDLTPVQREVVHTIALNWEALSAEEIAEKSRIDVDDVELVLEELENVFIIERSETDAPSPFYRLKERFFNIWYLMRLSSGGSRAKVVWLLHFLESWYSSDELQQHARKHIQAVAGGQYQAQSAYYLTEAFARTGQLDRETEHQMILATRRLLQESGTSFTEELSPSDKEIFKKGESAYQREEYEEALRQFLKLKHQDEHIQFRLGYAFCQLKEGQKAVPYLTRAAEKGHIEAMLNLGSLYHYHLHDYSNAERYYRMAVERKHTDAMLHLGNLYHHALKDFQKAEESYSMVLKEAELRSKVIASGGFSLKGLRNYLVTAIKGDIENPEHYQFEDLPGVKKDYLDAIQKTSAEALFQLGSLYGNEHKHAQKAEQYYHKAAEAGHLKAIMNLAELYNFRLKDVRKAEKYYLMAAEQGDLNAIVNLGLLYHEALKQYDDAEKYYTMAAEQGEITAMNALAWLYFEQQRDKEKALHYVQNVLAAERNMYTAHTAACVYLWNNRPEEAIELGEEFMYSPEAYDVLEQDILIYLMLLLAKECYEQIAAYFSHSDMNLHERYRPFHYACLYFSDDPEYGKCPPELSDPVEDIINKVTQMKSIIH